MDNKSLIKNSTYTLVPKLFTFLITLFTTSFITREWGDEIFGEYALIMSSMGLIGLFSNFGITTYFSVIISKYSDSNVAVHKIYKTYTKYQFVWTLIVIGAIIGIYYLGYFPEKFIRKEYIIPILFMSVALTIIKSNRSIFRAVGIFKHLGFIEIFESLSRNGAFLLSGVLSLGVSGVIYMHMSTYLAIGLFGVFWLIFYLKRGKGNGIKIREIEENIDNTTETILGFLPFFGLVITDYIFNSLGILTIGYFFDDKAIAGHYNVLYKLSELVFTPIASIALVMAPTLGYLKSNNKGGVKEILDKSFNIATLFSLVAIAILFFPEETILTMFGEQFKPSIPLLQIYGIHILFGVHAVFFSRYIDFLGGAKKRSRAMIITSIIYGTLVIIFTRYGVIYTVIITTICYASLVSYYFYYIIKQTGHNFLTRGLKINLLFLILGLGTLMIIKLILSNVELSLIYRNIIVILGVSIPIIVHALKNRKKLF